MMRSLLRRPRAVRFESLERRRVLAADIFISEFLASNDDGLLDEDGDSSDWIELFNAGPDDVDLGEYFLTDDDAELDKWAFPNQLLRADNFLLVFASDKDRAIVDQPLHTNFRLGASGEYLALTHQVAGDVQVVSEFAPEFPRQLTDVSFGATQQVDIEHLLVAGDSAKLLVPASTPDAAWTTVAYDDTALARCYGSDWLPNKGPRFYRRRCQIVVLGPKPQQR